MIAIASVTCLACTDPTASDSSTGDATPAPAQLPLSFSGAVLHDGNYCRFLQTAVPGNNTLPVEHGCQFDMIHPADLIATDGSNYSVSEVLGQAQLAVRGPAGSRVMIVCRLAPRGAFSFWVSSDGHWNISDVADVHDPHDLVSTQVEESLRSYLSPNGVQNSVQFKCAGGPNDAQVTLAVNINGHQFIALTVPMPEPGRPLDRPLTPWFVDLGARLVAPGELQGTAAALLLFEHE